MSGVGPNPTQGPRCLLCGGVVINPHGTPYCSACGRMAMIAGMPVEGETGQYGPDFDDIEYANDWAAACGLAEHQRDEARAQLVKAAALLREALPILDDATTGLSHLPPDVVYAKVVALLAELEETE